ncbi:zinc finger protein-like 1 [Trichogramma pretiosum]|uniref:zinc finger protein-like 1 n=1 Tax=Trichogramma pretiosum TaxID=7493 RepID=UPI0006C98CC1|nr:zinc finger protein-like 1 [Trichogramma pretiosum]
MGLCKCPKRKVTNQFCFEHRVNVCENCMVTNHPRCVIRSYLQWLQDCDCNPICTFCEESLSSRESCRLTCYHVYHWACLDAHCRSLSESTENANFQCPECYTEIIPQPNLVSPVADVLREKLTHVNWARTVLGLPMLSNDEEQKPNNSHNLIDLENSQSMHHAANFSSSRKNGSTLSSNLTTNNMHSNNRNSGPPYSVVDMESALANSSSRRTYLEPHNDNKNSSYDMDEKKYQKRSIISMFKSWYRVHRLRKYTNGSLRKRYAILLAVAIFSFIILMMLFSWLGKLVTDGDPSYDPMNNPMINVEDNN